MILPTITRRRIFAGQGPVEIAWPKNGPEPRIGHRYTIQSSRRAGKSMLVVEHRHKLADGWRVLVRLHIPTNLLGASGGYTEWPSHAIRARDEYPEPEGLDREDAGRLHREAGAENAIKREKQRRRHEVLADEMKLASERRRGKPATLREARVERAGRRLDEAA